MLQCSQEVIYVKKSLLILSVILLVLFVVFFIFYIISAVPKYAGDFSVADFEEYISNGDFQADINYGAITDYKSAATAGKTAISERFENSKGGIFEWMGCKVQYDKANDAYYIRTSHISPRMQGGAYAVIMKSDGTVLSIWGEK